MSPLSVRGIRREKKRNLRAIKEMGEVDFTDLANATRIINWMRHDHRKPEMVFPPGHLRIIASAIENLRQENIELLQERKIRIEAK